MKFQVSRRTLLGMLLGGATAVVTAGLSVPLFRFVFYPVFGKTSDTEWSEVGPVDSFKSLAEPARMSIRVEQRDGWRKIVSEKAVYVVPGPEGSFRVLSPVCPHLGCLIGWNREKRQFISPCHGGIFGANGELVAGPPRRAMDELETRVKDGKLEVKYRYFRPLVATKEVVG